MTVFFSQKNFGIILCLAFLEKNAVKVGAEKQIFFQFFFCCKTFKIPQKLKALAIFVKIQKFISGYWLSTQI